LRKLMVVSESRRIMRCHEGHRSLNQDVRLVKPHSVSFFEKLFVHSKHLQDQAHHLLGLGTRHTISSVLVAARRVIQENSRCFSLRKTLKTTSDVPISQTICTHTTSST